MSTKKTTLAYAGIATILSAEAVIVFATGQTAMAANTNVTIDIVEDAPSKGDHAFSESPLNVHVGDIVAWINKDSTRHTATSGSGDKPDGTPQIKLSNPSQEFKPTTPGDYAYFCALHPSMVGKLTVQPAQGS